MHSSVQNTKQSMDEIITLLQEIRPISLAEMKEITLMNRIDTKYIANIELLPQLLALSTDSYYVQEVNGQRLATYDTLYYDTPSMEMYLRHHDKQLCRQKIRTRTYVDSSLSFLEVKDKSNKGRTSKKRIPIAEHTFWDIHDDAHCEQFLAELSKYSIHALVPQVRTKFNRITLVNRSKTERLTIDINLQFENMGTKADVMLPRLMIIELKQDRLYQSEMKNFMLQLRIKPTKISKYCIGTALTNPNAKRNRFKIKIRAIDKIQHNRALP